MELAWRGLLLLLIELTQLLLRVERQVASHNLLVLAVLLLLGLLWVRLLRWLALLSGRHLVHLLLQGLAKGCLIDRTRVGGLCSRPVRRPIRLLSLCGTAKHGRSSGGLHEIACVQGRRLANRGCLRWLNCGGARRRYRSTLHIDDVLRHTNELLLRLLAAGDPSRGNTTSAGISWLRPSRND